MRGTNGEFYEEKRPKIMSKRVKKLLSIDLLTGDAVIRQGLERGRSSADLEDSWQGELAGFMERRREFLLYPD